MRGRTRKATRSCRGLGVAFTATSKWLAESAFRRVRRSAGSSLTASSPGFARRSPPSSSALRREPRLVASASFANRSQRRPVRAGAVTHGRRELMRGAVMHAPGDVRVEERDEPQIVEPTDAIIRVSAACVCGSDLWPYRGIGVEDVEWPAPMGHEYVG